MKRYLSGRTSSHRPAGVVSTVLRNSSPCGVLPGGACRTSCGIGPPVVVRHAVQHRALDALRHHPGGGRATTIRARLSTRASTSSTPPTSTHAASPRRSSPGPSKAHRDDLVIATKFGMPMGEDPNQRGGSRKWIVGEVENSLRRLGTDHIDLYQMHRPDHETGIGETLAALTDLVRAGKIRAFGSSMFPAEMITEAQWAAERQGSYRFTTEQIGPRTADLPASGRGRTASPPVADPAPVRSFTSGFTEP